MTILKAVRATGDTFRLLGVTQDLPGRPRQGSNHGRTTARACRHLQSGTTRALAKACGALLAAAVAASVLAACGGSESEPPSETQARQSPTALSLAAKPDDLAEEVTQHYFDALDRLGAILDQSLPVDDLREDVGNLKDEYIAVFLPYGYRREAMTDAERDTFDSAISRAVLLSTPPAFSKLSTAVANLNAAGETGLAAEIASFNILTQYVFFELLKEQDPQEAQRLGIP